MGENATFHSFKPSGKWYASGRGHLLKDVFECFTAVDQWKRILRANGGAYPGLKSIGAEFVCVVIPDEDVEFGYPLMLRPVQEVVG